MLIQMVCVNVRELPAAIQSTVRSLCMMANTHGGSITLKKCSLIHYDPQANALTISSPFSAVRFQFDEPKPVYRWN